MRKRILISIFIIFLLAGCSLPLIQQNLAARPVSAAQADAPLTVAEVAQAAEQEVQQILRPAAKDSTTTPTPFQPVRPTPTRTPTRTPTPRVTATPEPINYYYNNGSPDLSGASRPKGQVTILLLGSDARPTGGQRTDVIMLVAINPKEGTASVVSFPRDLFINIPGYGQERINVAYQVGGFPLLASTFETNFGVRPDHFVMTNFNGFVEVIDSLGGINVNCAQNLDDKCDVNGSGRCSYGPGIEYMDGKTALWYVRSRYSTSDFDRTRRAQEVVQAIFNRLMSMNAIKKAPQLYGVYRDNVTTDMGLGDILPLLPAANKIRQPNHVHRYTVGPEMVYDYITGAGAMVLMPNMSAIQQLVRTAILLP